VAGGVVIGDENVSIDDSGNVSIRILGMRLRRGAIDVVVIARALQERDANGAPGRILGLPLFSITVSPDS